MKKKIIDDFGFYAILTNPIRGYEYCANVLVSYEIPFIQLRVKDMSEYKILRIAEKLRLITENTFSKLIINDYPLIARDCGADGVHVGQTDMELKEVVDITGSDMIVGISTHNEAQTVEACKKEPDYIGIGPVFKTPTKTMPDPVIGIEGMKNMLKKSNVPSVCIGGITPSLLPTVLESGAKNFCMVRPLCSAQDPAKVVENILKMYTNFCEKQLSR